MLHFQPCQLSDTGARGLCPGWQLAVPRPGRLRQGLGLLLLPVQPGPSQTWYRSQLLHSLRRRLTHRSNGGKGGVGQPVRQRLQSRQKPCPPVLGSPKFTHTHKSHKCRERREHISASVCRKHQISSELSFNWLFYLIFWIKQFIGISSLIELIQKHWGKHAFTSFILENFKPTEKL